MQQAGLQEAFVCSMSHDKFGSKLYCTIKCTGSHPHCDIQIHADDYHIQSFKAGSNSFIVYVLAQAHPQNELHSPIADKSPLTFSTVLV